MEAVQKLMKMLESQRKADTNNNIKSVGLYEEFSSINNVNIKTTIIYIYKLKMIKNERINKYNK